MFHKLNNWFIPPNFRDDIETYRKAKLIVEFVWIGVFFGSLVIIGTFKTGQHNTAVSLFCAISISFLLLFVLKFKQSIYFVSHATLTAFFLHFCFIQYVSGGLYSHALSWHIVLIFLALMLTGPKGGYFWLSIVIIYFFTLVILDINGFNFPQLILPEKIDYALNQLTHVLGPSASSFALAYLFATSEQKALEQLREGLETQKKVHNLEVLFEQVNESGMEISSSSEKMVSNANQLAANSEQMSKQAGNVAVASEHMNFNIKSIASAAEEINDGILGMSSTTEEMSNNFNSIASSIEELSISMKEVGKTAKHGTKIAANAMERAQKAGQTMNTLGQAANEIGDVTEVIKKIADKTNLLALNAAIEAASAGDAGKGFAVVSTAIQRFADQSANAAEDIAARISGVQLNTQDAIKVIADVTEIVTDLNESSKITTIALEEQTKGVNEISENTSQANIGVNSIAQSMAELAIAADDVSKKTTEVAEGANEVTKNIKGVSLSTEDSNIRIQEVNATATELAKHSSTLHKIVDKFLVRQKKK